MSARLAKRRENVVALTHTEIMLVLATVILLLLLAKDMDLTQERKKVSALEEQISESADEAVERKEQANLAQEVKTILVNGGVAEENAKPARLAEAVSMLVTESRRDKAHNDVVNEALIQAGIFEDVEDDSDNKDDLVAEKN